MLFVLNVCLCVCVSVCVRVLLGDWGSIEGPVGGHDGRGYGN